MKTTRNTLMLGLMLTASAVAQGPNDDGGPKPLPHPRPPLMAALDHNDDGKLGVVEIDKASESLLGLDKDGNGRLTPKEILPPPPPKPEGGEPGEPGAKAGGEPGEEPGAGDKPRRPRPPRERGPSPLMLILDRNGDGNLSRAEIKDAPEALLGRDENNDGELTKEELAPKGPQVGPGGRPPHGPGPGGPRGPGGPPPGGTGRR